MATANCGKCGSAAFDRVAQGSGSTQIDLVMCMRCGAVLGAVSVRHSARMEQRLDEVLTFLAKIGNKIGIFP